jgi:hypothetical protein
METNHYLLLILFIFSIDILLFPSLAKNPEEETLPASPDLGDWWRSITVSDLADSQGNTLGVGPTSRSFGVLIVKVALVAVCVFIYFNKTLSNDKPLKLVNIITLMAIGMMMIKYGAYAGWFDDKQCSNYYISSIQSDKIEDMIYKGLYLGFSLMLAFSMKLHPLRNNDMVTVAFLMGVPFVIFVLHYLTMKLMYIGCESNEWFSKGCAISPASFYKEYITGGASESDTKSKAWDYMRRGLTVIVAITVALLMYTKRVSSSRQGAPLPLLLISSILAFGIPLLLNWLTTVDMERREASNDTHTVMKDGAELSREASGWRCIMNKYGGLSGYFIILLLQIYILQSQLTGA